MTLTRAELELYEVHPEVIRFRELRESMGIAQKDAHHIVALKPETIGDHERGSRPSQESVRQYRLANERLAAMSEAERCSLGRELRMIAKARRRAAYELQKPYRRWNDKDTRARLVALFEAGNRLSMRDAGQRLGVTKETVWRYIREMIEAGQLDVFHVHSSATRSAREYALRADVVVSKKSA